MSLRVSSILLFVLFLSKLLFVNAAPVESDKYDIAVNTDQPPGLVPEITPPSNFVFKFLLYASGVQIYNCTDLQKNWSFVKPEADLFTDDKFKNKVGTHFFQAKPIKNGSATWKSSLNYDDSDVITKVVNKTTPSPDNIPWLLTETTENQGNGAFSDVTYVVRIFTKNGNPPDVKECNKVGKLYNSDYTSQYWYFSAKC